MAASKGRVKLPPLVLDGEAKVLHKMTLRELHTCLTRALRAVGGDTVEESGRSVFSMMPKPQWWPQEIEFDAQFGRKLLPDQRPGCYCHLLSACYSHYKQEETLHLFDCSPGEPPRWRLVQENDHYTIVSTYTDRPIWTYANDYQLLPLATLAAKQAQQYREALGDRLKRPKTVIRDFVIRTRRQKLSQQLQPGSDQEEEAEEDSDDRMDGGNASHRLMSMASRHLLSPDGSPRRFSIMNRLPAHRFSIAEFFGDNAAKPDQPLPDLRCSQCNAVLETQPLLLAHMLQHHKPIDQDESTATKNLDLCMGIGLVQRHTMNDHETAIDKFETATSQMQKRWKPQFIGCLIPLTSEMGRNLFGLDNNMFTNDALEYRSMPYERFCQTSTPANGGKDNANDDQNPPATVDENSVKSEKPSSTNGKFYPIVYRPSRIIHHYHTFKFTSAERRLYARMQRNGGLNEEATALLKQCVPLVVSIPKLTKKELEAYKIKQEESDESESDSETADRKAIAAWSRSVGRRGPKARRSLNDEDAKILAGALATVRKKYWKNEHQHLLKRIGVAVPNRNMIKKALLQRSIKCGIRRSNRGLVPRREFSLVAKFGSGRRYKYQNGEPEEGVRRSKRGQSSQSSKGRPRREHRIPARYRSPERPTVGHGNEKRKKNSQKTSVAETSSTNVQLSPPPQQQQQLLQPPPPSRAPKNRQPGEVVMSIINKIRMESGMPTVDQWDPSLLPRLHMPAVIPSSSTSMPPVMPFTPQRKMLVQPLSFVLPKQPGIMDQRRSQQLPHAPPPYSILTSEHGYGNSGGYYYVDPEHLISMPQKVYGRFMAPRDLSPSVHEHMQETVNEVVFWTSWQPDDQVPEAYGISFDDRGNLVASNGLKSAIHVVKQEVMEEEPLQQPPSSPAGSESTIVSAIFEVPSSPDGTFDECDLDSSFDIGSPGGYLNRNESMENDAPPAKRLKMSFTEICAQQKLWTRAATTSPKKPAILARRSMVRSNASSPVKASNVIVNQGGTLNGKNQAARIPDLMDVNSNEKGPAMQLNSGGYGSSTIPKQHTATSIATANLNAIAIEPTTCIAKPTGEALKPSLIIISSGGAPMVTSGPITTGPHQMPAAKAIRIPMGYRLLPIPANRTTSAVAITTAPTTTVAACPGVIGNTVTVSSRPIRPRLLAAVSERSTMANANVTRVRPPQQQQNVVVQPSLPKRPIAPAPPKPSMSTNALQLHAGPAYMTFKCNLCDVQLQFATHIAWTQIQYHMNVAHRQRDYKLKKINKRPSGAVIIEAVKMNSAL